MAKIRADKLLFNQGLVESEQIASSLIMQGKVFTQKEEKILTPGQLLKEETELYIKGQKPPYVSRGGFKLKKAVDDFDISMSGKTILDIGSSTGGFTDVSLQEGARLVYALDVGTNQLDWKLRSDDRVVVMEQTNFRYSKPEDFTEGTPDYGVIDVSFISLKLILPPLYEILEDGGGVVALIKPQFEADRESVGEGGIIRDGEVHYEVVQDMLEFANQNGYGIQGLTTSPILGGKGNKEFLLYLRKNEDNIINIQTLLIDLFGES